MIKNGTKSLTDMAIPPINFLGPSSGVVDPRALRARGVLPAINF